MKGRLSKKSAHQPSMTVSLNSIATAKKQSGEQVFNFAAGEPVISSHAAVIKAVETGLKRGHVPYAPVKGTLDLRKAASLWMNSCYSANYSVEETIVTNGGKFALFGALQALLDEGEEILLLAPYWVSYPEMVKLSGGVPIVIQTEADSGWKATPELIKKHCTPKTKALLLNNACNPTGALYTRQELQKILELAQQLGLFVISDEVYSEIVYDGEFVSCAAFPQFASTTIVIQSCSKNFAMSGWRVGFAFAQAKIIEAIALFQSHMTTGTSLVSQWAAAAALEHASEISSRIKRSMLHNRDLACSLLKELFSAEITPPPSSLYLFLSLNQLQAAHTSAADYCMHVLKTRNVVLVPGEAFGTKGYVRLAFSCAPEEIAEGLRALKNASTGE
jgi:aspartate aminotransferase